MKNAQRKPPGSESRRVKPRGTIFIPQNLQKRNQLIVGPPIWAYKVLRETLGERFMENFERRISIDQFFMTAIALRQSPGTNQNNYHFSVARNRLFLHGVVKDGFFLAYTVVIKITRAHKWTITSNQTSCKKTLVNYNADPLLVEEYAP